MPDSTELEDLYSAIEESADLVGAACSRDLAWPVLSAYDAARQDVIAFRVATDAGNEGALDCRFSLPGTIDPYAIALSHNLTTATDHPIGELLADVRDRFSVDGGAVDFEVGGGFRKLWAFFPQGGEQTLSCLSDLPSMPPSVSHNAAVLGRNGLNKAVDVIGIDYHRKTVNLYFPERADPEILQPLHRELGLPELSEQVLRFCEGAFGVYATFGWGSSTVERISFGVKTEEPMTLPIKLDPRMEEFARRFPYGAGYPKQVNVAITQDGEEYYKLQLYYRWQPHGHRAGTPGQQ